MSTRREAVDRIPTLDGFRAISIGLVALYHLFRTRGFPSPPVLAPWMRWLGELGVRVFFVISGYLITGLLLRELRATGKIAIGRFYFRRALRLFPAFYAFLLVVAVLEGAGVIALNPGDLRSAATYTMNYHANPSWWLIHCWSLSVEEQFYLVWPATLALLGHAAGSVSRRRSWSAGRRSGSRPCTSSRPISTRSTTQPSEPSATRSRSDVSCPDSAISSASTPSTVATSARRPRSSARR
jgi:peptidoglycan/LPS O-acetylase OafA/YrhL